MENSFDLALAHNAEQPVTVCQVSYYHLRLSKLPAVKMGIGANIEGHHSIATLHQRNSQAGSQISGASGNQDIHRSSFPACDRGMTSGFAAWQRNADEHRELPTAEKQPRRWTDS